MAFHRIAELYATESTVKKYFPPHIIIVEVNDLYTRLPVILEKSMVALYKSSNNNYIVFAESPDTSIWYRYKMKLFCSEFNN